MFDRGDAGTNRKLDTFGAMRMSCHLAVELVGFVDKGLQFFEAVLRGAHCITFGQDSAGCTGLDHVGAVFDLITHCSSNLFWSISDSVLNARLQQSGTKAVSVT